jgi:hypothetical protein
LAVGYGEVNYHYLPFDKFSKNVVVLLNKTDVLGQGDNGDSKLMGLIQPNISEIRMDQDNYTRWTYPTNSYFGVQSKMNDNRAPEIIQIGPENIKYMCETVEDCALIVGAAGMTEGKASTYRIKGFLGSNQLKLNQPIKKEVPQPRSNGQEYDFYWFILNDTVKDPNVFFEYEIAVGSSSSTANPDLFVSVMDGRNPTSEDSDFSSTLIGADYVKISKDDPIWDLKAWNLQSAVMVVVGVKLSEPGSYHLSITRPSDHLSRQQSTRIDIGQSLEVILNGPLTDYYKLFKFFNWGHRTAKITLSPVDGSA